MPSDIRVRGILGLMVSTIAYRANFRVAYRGGGIGLGDGLYPCGTHAVEYPFNVASSIEWTNFERSKYLIRKSNMII